MPHPTRPLGRPRKDTDRTSTKDLILQLATKLFLEKGYPVVSMDDVAQKCNVTKATVYYYYKTKADLFTDGVVQLMVRISHKIREILATDMPLKEQLFILAKVHLEATIDVNIHAFMKEAKNSLSTEQQLLIKEAENKMYGTLEEAFKNAMASGQLPSTNPFLAAHLYISMLTVGNNIDINHEGRFQSLDDLVTQMINLYWDGLGGENQS